jgi:DNA-directed RNA polymerase specialized sigma24 family protein
VGRQVSLEVLAEVATDIGRPSSEVLAAEIGAAVRAGRITAKAAAPVFLTRVAGYSPTEAAQRLGLTPAAVRAVRSRAERRLVA